MLNTKVDKHAYEEYASLKEEQLVNMKNSFDEKLSQIMSYIYKSNDIINKDVD